jgi:NACHT domain
MRLGRVVDHGDVVLEACAGGLAKAVITRLAGSTAAAVVSKAQDEAALKKALTAALRATDQEHGRLVGRYGVDRGFFEHEGADEIARVLLPGRGPDPRRLARGYMSSLGGARAAAGSDALVEPFATLLGELHEQLGRHERFRVVLAQVAVTRSGGAGEIDERELLEWVCRRFAFSRTAGMGSIAHVQLRLCDVFVAPRALHEPRAGQKWSTRVEEQRALLVERVRNEEITHAQYEALLDRLGVEERAAEEPDSGAVAVSEVIRSVDLVVVLGNPGAGKTTLLGYLALRHAQALLDGDAQVSELGRPRLPLYLRAGDFSRSSRREDGVRAFIAPFLSMTLQCPVAVERLDQVVERALRAGRCLVLIDGLDEVTTAQDRTSVLASITEFVGAHQPRGNRFVCTSRISGYAAAPLPPEFATLRLLEMDDATIQRFLELYAPALEHAEAAGKDRELARRDAQHTVDELLEALRTTPGVRRLAANPLMLTALLLVQRTRGALPERRVDAYKAVTDALGHTWRATQGIPEADLPDERRLTQWLTRLAAWMHRERPEGSATLRELIERWGPLWADLQRQPWDPDVVDVADPAATDVGRAIGEFVEQIERHSGLLVERAPQRWGFPHLAFEEFYAGRALAFEGRATTRAKAIREHLHDPRYDEPILLALGLIGRDQPEELEAVFETSVLAIGEDTQRLGLHPSPLEDLLGRDFRFALRVLADDIPITPQLTDDLIGRAIDEALNPASLTRFTAYRNSLLERIGALAPLAAGNRVSELLAQRLGDSFGTSTPDARERFTALAARCPTRQALPATVSARLAEIAADEDSVAAIRAAHVLGARGELPAAVSTRLAAILAGEDASAASFAAQVMGAQGKLPAAVEVRLAEIIACEDFSAASIAAQALGSQEELPAAVSTRLVEIIAGKDSSVALRAAQMLGARVELVAAVNTRLAEIVAGDDCIEAIRAAQLFRAQGWLPAPVRARLADITATQDSVAAILAAELLGDQAELPAAVSARLADIIATQDSVAAIRAAEVLGAQGQLPTPVSTRLTEMITVGDPAVASIAAEALGQQAQLPKAVSTRLADIIAGKDSVAAIRAAEVLGAHAQLPARVSSRLGEIIADDDSVVAVRAAQLLDAQAQLPATVTSRLGEIIADDDSVVAIRAAQVLGARRQLPAKVSTRLAEIVASEPSVVAILAAQVLGAQEQLPAAVSTRLAEIAAETDLNSRLRAQALTLGAQTTQPSRVLIASLLDRLGDDNNYVRNAAVQGLISHTHQPEWRRHIMRAVFNAADASFLPHEHPQRRPAHDYAYDALWQICQDAGATEVRADLPLARDDYVISSAR